MRQHRQNTPAYLQIQEAILKCIEAQQLGPGDAVASERELARIYRVSLMTARHALVSLESCGIVVRRQGSGTFVAPHSNRLMSFNEEMAGRKFPISSRILCLTVVDNERNIPSLSRMFAARLAKLQWLRLAAGEPFAVETYYLPLHRFPGITEKVAATNSLFDCLRDKLRSDSEQSRRGG